MDPLVGTRRQPYAYAGDNPINASDPSGLLPCCGGGGNPLIWFWFIVAYNNAVQEQSDGVPFVGPTAVKGVGWLVTRPLRCPERLREDRGGIQCAGD
jgi:hypothetical protein